MNQNTSVVSQARQNRPRRRDAAARWRKLLEDHRASGLPISVFCRERGIPASSLFAWRRRLSSGAGIFKPVKLLSKAPAGGADGDGAIELCLRGGRHLLVRRGFDAELLGELVEAMEGLPSTMESLA